MPVANLLIFSLFIFGLVWAISCPRIKIWQPTSSRLEFRYRSVAFWRIGAFLSELGFLLAILAWKLTALTTLTCSHFTPDLSFSTQAREFIPAKCELIKTNFRGIVQSRTLVTKLQGAYVEKRINTNPESSYLYYYRVVILTEQKRIPLTINWEHGHDFEARYLIYDQDLSIDINRQLQNSQTKILIQPLGASLKFIRHPKLFSNSQQSLYANMQAVVSRINAFAKNPLEPALVVQDNLILGGYIGFGLGCLLGLASLLIIAATPTVSCTFSQEMNSMTLKRRRCLITKVFQESLERISDVKLESNPENSCHRISLLVTSGESLPLTFYQASSWEKKQQIAQSIRIFLGSSISKNGRC